MPNVGLKTFEFALLIGVGGEEGFSNSTSISLIKVSKLLGSKLGVDSDWLSTIGALLCLVLNLHK